MRVRPPAKRVALATALLVLLVVGHGVLHRAPPARQPTPAPSPAPVPHNCRFWACVADSIPAALIRDHLISLPRSLEQQSVANYDGWSIGFAVLADPARVLRRGEPAAHLDSLFDVAVAVTMEARPQLAVAHVRRCSSGDCEIPNPHPFVRDKDGRRWWMGHNGAIDVDVLLALIRPDYLIDNPPANGSGPDDWIDSELYFLYVLQTLEDHGWHVKPALGEVIQTLRAWLPGEAERLNFFLTDGEQLWSYRQGPTLYYLADDAMPVVVTVASQYPDSVLGNWTPMSDGDLLSVVPGGMPLIESIEDYFLETAGTGETAVDRHAPGPAAAGRLIAWPNPFHESTRLLYVPSTGLDGDHALPAAGQPARGRMTLDIYDVSGRLVRRLVPGADGWGNRVGMPAAGRATAESPGEAAGAPAALSVVWDGRDARGRRSPAGVYLARGAGDREATATTRLVLLP